VKLAQGLANALQAFINQNGLEREIWDRIEQEVARQGVAATLRMLTAYYSTSEGRDQAPELTNRQGDDLVLELKRLVRSYADELRQIHQFVPGSGSLGDEARPRPANDRANAEEAHGH
jgi:hypothetical protein